MGCNHGSPPLDLPDDCQGAIAVVGLAVKFPQEASSIEGFWSMLAQGRCAMTDFPSDRLNIDAFYHPDASRYESFPLRGAHFLQEDVTCFDAPFFAISAAEAAAMDPQQRGLLETAYHALENAGITMESAVGSNTSVYVGSFTEDYKGLITRDQELRARYAATGLAASILANRISWFFDLKGPSMQLDAACSSSLMAFHQACLGLRNGESDMALVGGCNLIFNPEFFAALSNLNFLSPDSRCWSFDHRANGYARGEGFSVVVLKPLINAIRNGDTIRAVVRGTGANQDGRTPGLTQPNGEAQLRLILETYAKAGLDRESTRFFEAHGTGTALGDPIEANAIGRAFRDLRSPESPLYVGAVKSNIGHLEGASGIAGLIKAILVLEHGVIPPNANFEKVNPRIDIANLKLKFPLESVPWPTGDLRRISINCFGFGGANVHVILDDAYNYLKSRNIVGNHSTAEKPPPRTEAKSLGSLCSPTQSSSSQKEYEDGQQVGPRAQLLVWSAADEGGIIRLAEAYSKHYLKNDYRFHENDYLGNLSYTLSQRRSSLPWKAYAIVNSINDLPDLQSKVSKAAKSLMRLNLGFVFTGQGAQWHAMGRELLCYPVYLDSLQSADKYFKFLGCPWSLLEELQKDKESSNVHSPEFSQPLCTAVQVALVELLKSFSISPSVVIGHSSGEIAAAFCIGAISRKSAWRLAYYRGVLAAALADMSLIRGAMISVGLSKTDVQEYLNKVTFRFGELKLSVACVNSPSNVTISGEEEQIDALRLFLDEQHVFARKLQVNVAYHSPYMAAITNEYLRLCKHLEEGEFSDQPPIMVSSVTVQRVSPHDLRKSQYWVKNLVSPVYFAEALALSCGGESTRVKKIGMKRSTSISMNHLVEIGPHSTLQGPIKETLKSRTNGQDVGYSSVLKRGISAVDTVLQLVGRLHCLGYKVSLQEANKHCSERTAPQPLVLTDLPEYSFNHSKSYWLESRLSRDYRFRKYPRLDLLGTPMADWNSLEARWRNIISRMENPWIEDHKVNGIYLYPAAGMLAMAIEAARLQADPSKEIVGFTIYDAFFLRGLNTTLTPEGVDTSFYLRAQQQSLNKSSTCSEFRLCICENGIWYDTCRGIIEVAYQSGNSEIDNGKEAEEETLQNRKAYKDGVQSCNVPISFEEIYQSLRESGYEYGTTFQPLQNASVGHSHEAVAEVDLRRWTLRGDEAYAQHHVIHPTTLDGLMQLALVALNNGGQERIPTLVPTRIDKLWVASSGLSEKGIDPLKCYAKSTRIGQREALSSVIVLDSSQSKLQLFIEGLQTTAVADKSLQSSDETIQRQLCYNFEWKPDIEFLQTKNVLDHVQKQDENSAELESQLHRILCNELDAQAIQTPRETLAQYLREYWEKSASRQAFTTCLDLMAHKYPSMAILEIGNGIGTIAYSALSTLILHGNQEVGAQRFARYDHTDTTALYFPKVQEDLKDHVNRLSLRVLDFECEPQQQGFDTAGYDLVIASDLALLGKDISLNLKHIRKLLKPGGKLLFIQIVNQDLLKIRSVRCFLSKQWLSSGDHEAGMIHLSQSNWFDILKRNGFSTGNLAFPVYRGTTHHENNIILATADTFSREHHLSPIKVMVILDQNSIAQQHIAARIQMEFSAVMTIEFSVQSLHQAAKKIDLGSWFCILLSELETPLLQEIDVHIFSELKAVLLAAKNMIYITSGKQGSSLNPSHHLITGLARVLRTENSRTKFVTLALQYANRITSDQINHIVKVFNTTLVASTDQYEPEYTEHDGTLQIGRVIEAQYLNDHISQSKMACRSLIQPFGSGLPLAMTVGSPGLLDTLEFHQDLENDKPLGNDEVEIEVVATGVNFRDCLTALGRLTSKTIGVECAGIVKRVGERCSTLKTGDRVAASHMGTYKTYVRCNELCAVRIPDGLPLAEAAGMLTTNTTVYYSLLKIARAQSGETILIHGGAGGTGQAAIQLSQSLGLEVFVTVSSGEKRQLVMDTYRIAEDHVLYSRDLSFAKGIRRMTSGRGVDIVLNSLADEAIQASWECVAPFGRFIDIGNKNILSNDRLPMQQFAKNVSFSAVDLAYITQEAPTLMNELLNGVMALIAKKILKPAMPFKVFAASEIEKAFRYLQGGSNMGKVVVRFNFEDQVRTIIRNKPAYMFNPNATYLIAGGLGGLGRSIARWMVSRGAMNLVLLSRSGPRNKESHELLKELRNVGVSIEAIPCDITKAESLSLVLDLCERTLPPIKGVIQATMVLQDTMFEKMTFDQWKASVDPKVQGSWNLHTLLPKGMDFFIFLSSISGIIGAGGQANYAAGNNYEDALAHYRVSHGERATSLCLGMMKEEGVLSEDGNQDLVRLMRATGAYMELTQNDLYALLDYHCNPALGLLSALKCHIVTGIETPSTVRARSLDEPIWMQRPTFRYLHQMNSEHGLTSLNEITDHSGKFQAASSLWEASDVVCDALVQRLARALMTPEEDIVKSKPIHSYGVDSLVAVEIRNLFLKEFRADIAIFDILGNRSLASVCELVAKKSECRKSSWEEE